ncbi:MAG TPA: chemotaxis protein CheW [Dehalococcoidales bacterium]
MKTNSARVAIDWDTVHRRMSETAAILEQKAAPSTAMQQKILRERAKALAQKPLDKTTQNDLEILEFRLAGERYGIEIAFIREVYPLRELVPLPGTPAFVLGITSVRGQILSVIDLKKLLNLPEKGLTERDKIIIVRNDGIEVGIRADAVEGVGYVSSKELQPTLPTLTDIQGKYLKGISKEHTIILDMMKLLTDKEIIINQEVET